MVREMYGSGYPAVASLTPEPLSFSFGSITLNKRQDSPNLKLSSSKPSFFQYVVVVVVVAKGHRLANFCSMPEVVPSGSSPVSFSENQQPSTENQQLAPGKIDTSPKFSSSPLKNDGWKMILPSGMVNFQGLTVKLPGMSSA